MERDECRETVPSLEPPGDGSAALTTALAASSSRIADISAKWLGDNIHLGYWYDDSGSLQVHLSGYRSFEQDVAAAQGLVRYYG